VATGNVQVTEDRTCVFPEISACGQTNRRTDRRGHHKSPRSSHGTPSLQLAPLSAAGKAALNYRIVVHDIVPLVAVSAVCRQGGGKLPPMSGRPILM